VIPKAEEQMLRPHRCCSRPRVSCPECGRDEGPSDKAIANAMQAMADVLNEEYPELHFFVPADGKVYPGPTVNLGAAYRAMCADDKRGDRRKVELTKVLRAELGKESPA
jgi:hypothetical protein